jgi:5-methylthioribose kinase
LRRKAVGHAPRRVPAVYGQRYDEEVSLLIMELEGIE